MKITGILIISLVAASCGMKYHDSISGNGKVRTIEVSTDTVTHIIVSDRIDLLLIPSDSTMVVLEADENLHDVINISVDNGLLRISTDKYIRIARSKEVRVYGNQFCKIETSTKASVMSSDTIVCDEFSLSACTGADARIIGHFNSLMVNGSSGCDIFLEGKADYLNITANSASDIYGFDFSAKKGDVFASSASDVRITILGDAHFDASSAADIIYRGNPSIIDSRSSSMGEIRQSKF